MMVVWSFFLSHRASTFNVSELRGTIFGPTVDLQVLFTRTSPTFVPVEEDRKKLGVENNLTSNLHSYNRINLAFRKTF